MVKPLSVGCVNCDCILNTDYIWLLSQVNLTCLTVDWCSQCGVHLHIHICCIPTGQTTPHSSRPPSSSQPAVVQRVSSPSHQAHSGMNKITDCLNYLKLCGKAEKEIGWPVWIQLMLSTIFLCVSCDWIGSGHFHWKNVGQFAYSSQ